MTTYGTISTSSSLSTNLEFISQIKERIKAGLANHRSWKIMFNLRLFGFPGGFFDAISRIRKNWAYFQVNYFILLLLGLFLSCLWHLTSIIVFAVYVSCMLYLQFLRDDPLVILGHPINDHVMMVLTLVVMLVLELLIDHEGIISEGTPYALMVGLTLVHTLLRKTDYLLSEEDVAGLTPAAAS